MKRKDAKRQRRKEFESERGSVSRSISAVKVVEESFARLHFTPCCGSQTRAPSALRLRAFASLR
jgi:hypothetical protein